MLPSSEQTAFFRACLYRDSALDEAWRDWLRSVGDPLRYLREAGREMRRFLPLLHHNLTDNNQDVPPGLKPYLRAAMLREQLRWQLFETCVNESFQILVSAGIDFTVLKGAAVSHMLFRPPLLRHCHDLDLWVSAVDRPRAAAALAASGFTMGGARNGTTQCAHPQGLPVLLHSSLLRAPAVRLPQNEIRIRRQTIETPGGSWKVLARPDLLLHCCGQASSAARRPHANWVIDAYHLSTQMDERDWKEFLTIARRTGLSLSLLVLLRYLKEDLAARIPSPVISELASAANTIESASLMSAIDGGWLGRPGGVVAMFRKSGWRSRVTLARLLLFPPAEYLRTTRGSMGRVRLALEYPVRPVRHLVRSAYRRAPE